jgi:hypothetical protein
MNQQVNLSKKIFDVSVSKKGVISLLAFLLCKLVIAQVAVQKILSLKKPIKSEQVVWAVDLDKRYFLCTSKSECNKNFLKIFIIDAQNKNNHSKEVQISIPTVWCSEETYFNDAAVDYPYFVVCAFDRMIVFDISKNVVIDTLFLKNFERVFALGKGKFLFLKMYNHHPLSDQHPFELAIYDASFKKIEKTLRISNYKDLPYTIMVGSFVDVTNNYIAIAHSTEFRIDIYDINLQKVDSIVIDYPPMKKNIFLKESETSLLYHSGQEVYKTLKTTDTVNTRIEKIFFNTDSCILVSIRPPKSDFKERKILWVEKKDNKWQITKTYDWKRNDFITKEEMFFDYTFSDKMILKNNQFIQFATICPTNKLPLKKSTFYDSITNKEKLPHAFYIFNLPQ